MNSIRTHKIFPDVFPAPWASGWGEDEYGLWMAFTYKGVPQVFRWCEPGTFMMGSPDYESEREDDETCHTVKLTKGFWLAETTVTQALWKVVMGENRSEFKGDERPVENVNWYDADIFIGKLNALKPKLKLCLPTEAQWEYACRAGISAPFSWGPQIDPKLVNYKGNKPFNNGPKGRNRRKTISVKELPCNDWGLYQMHGNVWEWCQDWHKGYDAKTAIDPTVLEHGNYRVLRGGSWNDSGRGCRSACRGSLAPSIRMQDIGFRLARGH